MWVARVRASPEAYCTPRATVEAEWHPQRSKPTCLLSDTLVFALGGRGSRRAACVNQPATSSRLGRSLALPIRVHATAKVSLSNRHASGLRAI